MKAEATLTINFSVSLSLLIVYFVFSTVPFSRDDAPLIPRNLT